MDEVAMYLQKQYYKQRTPADYQRLEVRSAVLQTDLLYKRLIHAAEALGIDSPALTAKILQGRMAPTTVHVYLDMLVSDRMSKETYRGLLMGEIPVGNNGKELVYLH